MLMNKTIKSGDGVEYSIHKTVRVGVYGPIQIHKPNNATSLNIG